MPNKPQPTLFLKFFQARRQEEELMDMPTTSRKDFTEALYDIQWVNSNLGGINVLLAELMQFLPAHPAGYQPTSEERPFTILDLGTGSADIPRAIVQWARQQPAIKPLNLHITAVDVHPVAVDVARQMGHEYPEIRIVQADALHLDFMDGAFDVVISSMFMHHLHNDEAVRLLQEMSRLCRRGFIVNDLERHPLAWLGIKALGFLQGKGKIFQNDAPLSVLRGFTQQELAVLKDAAGLPNLEIHHRPPYRWLLSWKKSHHWIIPQHLPLDKPCNN